MSNKMTETKRERICLTTVRAMGFTDQLIKELLPEPKVLRNPHYSCATPMKLWYKDDVENAMHTKEFMESQELRKKKVDAAKKAVQTKTDKLMEQIKKRVEEIQVEVVERDQLRKNVLVDMQNWHNTQSKGKRAINPRFAYEADEDMVMRYTIRYIRENLITYDRNLMEIAGKTGKSKAYEFYINAVIDRIIEAYPDLNKDYIRRMFWEIAS